jgi:DNA-binding transcriptional MocR family regulator
VGWIAPGKHKEKVLKLKLAHSISSTTVIHEAVGNFMKTGRYERHLKGLRWTLLKNYQEYVRVIAEYFPEGTKTSRPQGGLALWVEFDKHVDTKVLYDRVLRQGISIAPGRMFTLQEQFQHCMRLCFGLPWSDDMRRRLKQVGDLAKKM